MLRLHPKEHTLLEFVGKAEHNHKNNTSKQCVPSGEYGQKKKKKRLSQCGGAQKGLGVQRKGNSRGENGIIETGILILSSTNQPTNQPTSV